MSKTNNLVNPPPPITNYLFAPGPRPHAPCPMPHAPCPMPHAPCPMPNN
ncbi:hypothetical protein QUB57_06935 [Microcoleus sp. F6_C1]